MRLDFTPEQIAWRNEIRAFLKENLPREYDDELSSASREHFDFMMEFNRKLAKKGWLIMSWPKGYGGAGAGLMEQLIFHEEYGYHRAPNLGPGVRFVGPSIMVHGSDEQKAEHLPHIAANTRWWCQGFSEPGSGSDLASLQTRGVVDGDEIVVNGSKIWTSWAHMSDWCWLAVRTDPDARKHRGISILMVDLKWPGITIRPVPNMAGYHSFNQVFFDDLRVPRANMVGPMNRRLFLCLLQ
jgi:alkylation response protein AidB-like acyl-CoA dehydrogenase